MEAKEIIEIIVGILASISLTVCIAAVSYGMYSTVTTDKELKRYSKEANDTLAKLEKEEE